MSSTGGEATPSATFSPISPSAAARSVREGRGPSVRRFEASTEV